MSGSIIISGVVHGKTIELDQEPGFPEGERVRVTVQSTSPNMAGEGLKKAFGAWAENSAELDDYLQWNRERRKTSRSECES